MPQTHVFARRSQQRTVESYEPVMAMVASALRLMQFTRLLCPRSFRIIFPEATSQKMSDLSEEHDANLELSCELGMRLNEGMQCEWLFKVLDKLNSCSLLQEATFCL